MLAWNLFTTIVYLFSIFIDTLVIGFHLVPLLSPNVATWTSTLSVTMAIDVGLKFVLAFPSNSSFEEIDDEEDE